MGELLANINTEIASAVFLILLALSMYWIIKLYVSIHRLKQQLRGVPVRRGYMIEQLLPFAKNYPWSPQSFKFLGDPIDGIHFEKDEIVLVEFKSGNSQLSDGQKRVRELVSKRKVVFKEVRAKIKNEDLVGIEIK